MGLQQHPGTDLSLSYDFQILPGCLSLYAHAAAGRVGHGTRDDSGSCTSLDFIL